jgi:hypothetical protein
MSKAAKLILLASIIFPACGQAYGSESSTGAPPPGSASAPLPVPPASPSPLLREDVAKESVPPAQDNSVESFFQIGARRSAQGVLMQPATVTSSAASERKSRSHGLYRCIWHILDNAGVPMFVGHESYIDPSISGRYLIPSPKLLRDSALAKELEKATTGATQPPPSPAPTASQPMPQKIPASELEGVVLPAPRDVHESAP